MQDFFKSAFSIRKALPSTLTVLLPLIALSFLSLGSAHAAATGLMDKLRGKSIQLMLLDQLSASTPAGTMLADCTSEQMHLAFPVNAQVIADEPVPAIISYESGVCRALNFNALVFKPLQGDKAQITMGIVRVPLDPNKEDALKLIAFVNVDATCELKNEWSWSLWKVFQSQTLTCHLTGEDAHGTAVFSVL